MPGAFIGVDTAGARQLSKHCNAAAQMVHLYCFPFIAKGKVILCRAQTFVIFSSKLRNRVPRFLLYELRTNYIIHYRTRAAKCIHEGRRSCRINEGRKEKTKCMYILIEIKSIKKKLPFVISQSFLSSRSMQNKVRCVERLFH
jgi:hypothetical protein